MKKLIIVAVMFIVNIAGISKTFAQSGPTGTGFFRPEFEYENDRATIKDNFKKAMVKAFSADLSCFQRDADQTPGPPAAYIVRKIGERLRIGSGRNLTGEDVVRILQAPAGSEDYVQYLPVSQQYWDSHRASYFMTSKGAMGYWDPRTSSLFKRTEWIIARWHINGNIIDQMASCANLVIDYTPSVDRNDGDEHFPPANTGCAISFFGANPTTVDAGKMSILSWTTTCSSVTITGVVGTFAGSGSTIVYPTQTTTYLLTTNDGKTAQAVVAVNVVPIKAKGVGFFHTPWPYIIGAAIIGGGVYLATRPSSDGGNGVNPPEQGPSGKYPNTPGDAGNGPSFYHPSRGGSGLILGISKNKTVSLGFKIGF